MQSCHSNICFVLLNISPALFRFVFILLEQRLERGCGRGHLSLVVEVVSSLPHLDLQLPPYRWSPGSINALTCCETCE